MDRINAYIIVSSVLVPVSLFFKEAGSSLLQGPTPPDTPTIVFAIYDFSSCCQNHIPTAPITALPVFLSDCVPRPSVSVCPTLSTGTGTQLGASNSLTNDLQTMKEKVTGQPTIDLEVSRTKIRPFKESSDGRNGGQVPR